MIDHANLRGISQQPRGRVSLAAKKASVCLREIAKLNDVLPQSFAGLITIPVAHPYLMPQQFRRTGKKRVQLQPFKNSRQDFGIPPIVRPDENGLRHASKIKGRQIITSRNQDRREETTGNLKPSSPQLKYRTCGFPSRQDSYRVNPQS